MGSDSKLQKQLFCGAFKSVLDERMHFKFKDGHESFVSAFNSKTYKNGALQLISTYSWKHIFKLKWTKLHCTDLHEYKLCCATPTPPTSTQVYLKTQKTSKHVKRKKKKRKEKYACVSLKSVSNISSITFMPICVVKPTFSQAHIDIQYSTGRQILNLQYGFNGSWLCGSRGTVVSSHCVFDAV